MANKLFSIDISEGPLDNVYTFFDDATIERFFDHNQYSLNNTVSMTWQNLKGRSDLKKIKSKCSESQLAVLKQVFGDL